MNSSKSENKQYVNNVFEVIGNVRLGEWIQMKEMALKNSRSDYLGHSKVKVKEINTNCQHI